MVLMRGFGEEDSDDQTECQDQSSEEEIDAPPKNVLSSIFALDFNHLIFNDRPFSKQSAWVVLGFRLHLSLLPVFCCQKG